MGFHCLFNTVRTGNAWRNTIFHPTLLNPCHPCFWVKRKVLRTM